MTSQVVLEDLLGACREKSGQYNPRTTLWLARHTFTVPDLRINRRSRHVRYHAVTTTQGVPHRPPRVIRRRRLREPHVASITTEVARVERVRNGLGITNGTSSGVDEPRSWFHLGKKLLVEQALGLLVQGTVDGDDVALGEHVLERLDTSDLDRLSGLFRQCRVIEV